MSAPTGGGPPRERMPSGLAVPAERHRRIGRPVPPREGEPEVFVDGVRRFPDGVL
ncbi:hypothetical protein [Streptomyces erythrochromogenes]|uniref:hypothetical protein n=1 Tax=Streptomyces erythrochromogenes TaxID=285574 RepID=UPI00386CB454|nr:hypothetical protein OG489_33570 [Streptomyces erythrochromogenes]